VTQDIVAAGYDAVYAATTASQTLRRLWREHAAGVDFPDEFSHISFVTLGQLRRMRAELRLGPEKVLADIGCGMGGPALWMARETGARLVGIDLSPVAAAIAAARARELGLAEQARFVVGSFGKTGLEDSSMDGVMSEDALQYAPDKRVAIIETARILRPGGRLVCTTFELVRKAVVGLPVLGVDPLGDYRPLLKESGFSVETYQTVPGWPEPMRTAYQALLEAREALLTEMGEAAVAALFSELTLTLQVQPYRRRVLLCATRGRL